MCFVAIVVMKMYTNMTNIIVRLSCGEACDENAILLNSHYDTTLGSPGAVDDALPVGVMLEVIRIISQRPAAKKNSLIFCKREVPKNETLGRTHNSASYRLTWHPILTTSVQRRRGIPPGCFALIYYESRVERHGQGCDQPRGLWHNRTRNPFPGQFQAND